MIVVRINHFSGKEQSMDLDVTEEQLHNYFVNRAFLQDAFPQLSPEERDFIKFGVTPEQWKEIFGE
jgi:hypothetical protein